MLDTVDLPMWLSGMRKESATGLSTPNLMANVGQIGVCSWLDFT
jgi:hypothetical protein